MPKNEIKIVVSVKNLAAKSLKSIGAGFKRLGIGLLKFPFKLITTGLKRIAQVGLVALSAALGKAVFDAAKFETEFAKVKTLLDETSFEDVGLSLKEGIKFLEREAIDTMAKFGLSIEDTNKALFDTVSAGIPASKSIEFLNAAAKLSIGGVTSLSTSVNGLTSIMNAFKLETDDTDRVARAFFTAQKFGKTTVEQLANAVGKVAPIAKSAGVSFEELLAVTSQLTLSGLSTDEAVTSLRSTISALIKPTNDAKRVFTELGIPFGKAAFEGGKLGETMAILSAKSEGNIDVIAELIPNIRALTGVTSLNEEGLKSYNIILDNVINDTTSLNNAFEVQTKTLGQQFKIFKSESRKIGILFAKEVTPILTDLLVKINGLAPTIARNVPRIVGKIKKLFIDLKLIAAIGAAALKELIAAPFRPETYLDIFQALLAGVGILFEKLKALLKGTFSSIRADELAQNKTFKQELTELLAQAAKDKAKIDKETAKAEKEAAKERIELAKITSSEVIDLKEAEGDEIVKIAKKTDDWLAFINKEQIARSKDFFEFIVSGTRSANIAISTVAKAVALFQIAIKTKQAAMNAMATVPYPLNFAAAATVIAFGAEQAAAVVAQQPNFQEGGIVPGSSFSGDRIGARVNSGEMILNREQQKQLFDVANGKGISTEQPKDLTVVIRVGEKDIAETVVQGYNTSRNLDLIPQLTTE